MCRNDELLKFGDELSWLFTNRFRATRYMKVKRMGITEILRRIWLFSVNKINSSESGSKQPTQLIIVAHNCHNRTWVQYSGFSSVERAGTSIMNKLFIILYFFISTASSKEVVPLKPQYNKCSTNNECIPEPEYR